MTVRKHGLLLFPALLAGGAAAHAQGVLTATPGTKVATLAGTGTVGLSGTTGANATLAYPRGVAFDAVGNLYFADTENQVVRKVTTAGAISTVAGTGTEGFGGDGGAATSAMLDNPSGVAIDAAGNLYITDTFNNRVREVSGGTITTIAGTGALGYSGDGAAASSATLAHPLGLAFDGSGNLYVADAGNHVVRRISAGTISTVAGSGTEGYAGDGAAAVSAFLDTPAAVSVDLSGALYIADRNNQVIRKVVGTTISTFAGNHVYGFAGDGGAATSASLARPNGVTLDPFGNLFIADKDNDRIREVSAGNIVTAAGNGLPEYNGDGQPGPVTTVQQPRAVMSDALGDVAFSDAYNQRVRSLALPVISFGSVAGGTTSPAQNVTLANSGSASLSVSSISFTGSAGFSAGNGGSCGAVPFTLAAGASCTVALLFQPSATTPVSGQVAFNAGGGGSQTILLTGDSGTTTTNLRLAAAPNAGTFGTPVTLTATLSAAPAAGESVSFSTGGTSLGSAPLNGSSASLTTSALPTGTDTVTASYGGDSQLAAAAGTAGVTITQASPAITWKPSTGSQPAGVAISSGVLDATANVPGTFVYSTVVAGNDTILTAGSSTLPAGNYVFVVNFTPSDTTDYTAASTSIPFTITGETVWLVNSNQTLSEFDLTGTAISASSGISAGSLGPPVGPRGAAWDGSGHLWVAGTGVAEYDSAGNQLINPGTTVGGIHMPRSIAIDGQGQVWATSPSTSVLSVLSSSGAAVSPSTGYNNAGLITPYGITVDISGNVWVTDNASHGPNSGVVTEFIGAAAPVNPPAVSITNGTTGARP